MDSNIFLIYNIEFHIFQDGYCTTNQHIYAYIVYIYNIYIYIHTYHIHQIVYITELDDGNIYRKPLYSMVKTMVSG